MREEKSYYEIKREEIKRYRKSNAVFFSSFQTWSVTILARASLINEGKELR
jgi:hypothetical protein